MCESSAVGCLGAADDASGRATVQSVSEFGLYEWVCNEHKIQVMRQEKKKKKKASPGCMRGHPGTVGAPDVRGRAETCSVDQ